LTKLAKRPAPDAPPPGSGPQPKSYEKVIANWTRVLAFSTIALFIATAISAYFLHETDQTIKKQVGATRIQLRAYVGLGPFFLIKTVSKEGKPDGLNVGHTWKNFGSTPATDLKVWLSARWHRNGSEPDFSRPESNPSDQFAGIIGPGAELGSGPVGVPLSDLEKAVAGDGRIFIWGHAEYRDSFPETPVRHFHFCMKIAAQTIDILSPQVYKTECNYSD
jgi:hypothetical protein